MIIRPPSSVICRKRDSDVKARLKPELSGTGTRLLHEGIAEDGSSGIYSQSSGPASRLAEAEPGGADSRSAHSPSIICRHIEGTRSIPCIGIYPIIPIVDKEDRRSEISRELPCLPSGLKVGKGCKGSGEQAFKPETGFPSISITFAVERTDACRGPVQIHS